MPIYFDHGGDDIDHNQPVNDDCLDDNQRRAIDNIIPTDVARLINEFGPNPRAVDLRAAFVSARDVLNECIAIIDRADPDARSSSGDHPGGQPSGPETANDMLTPP